MNKDSVVTYLFIGSVILLAVALALKSMGF
jgi:hypothetical protein